jgi:MHS family proline/betaine transporter-like MFS transporter
VRPLGGLVFGRIGDLLGRRRALLLSVMAMAVPTVLIGCLPTYAQIGVLAPVLIVVMRIVQGLSVGGEYTCSLVFLAEHATEGKRARTAVWGMWGATAGILLGSAVGALVAELLDAEALANWGWRVPFWMGAVVAVTGILIRRAIRIKHLPSDSQAPVRDTFTRYLWPVVKVALLNVALGVSFYAAFVYSVTFFHEINGVSQSTALNINTVSMVVLLVVLPLAAWASDRFGRRPLLIIGTALLVFGSVPFFGLMHSASIEQMIAGELGFVLGVGLMGGGLAGANVELVPHQVRCTGLAFAYNASVGWFGGTTPLIATWLIASTGNPVSPGWWVAAAGAVSLFTALFLVSETHYTEL